MAGCYGWVTVERWKPVLAALPGSGVAGKPGWEPWRLCKSETFKLILSEDPWLADAARKMLVLRKRRGWSR